jgi:hypothetical protein
MSTPVPQEQLEDYQLYIDPFVAYRSWAIICDEDDQKVKLRSITYKTPWPSGEPMVAGCYQMHYGTQPEPHDTPDAGHSCGIHAVKDDEDAIMWMGSGFTAQHAELRCYGEVKLWGKVLRYTKGYLSQYAYPVSLFLDPQPPENFPIESREAAKELRRTYRGVEVRLM